MKPVILGNGLLGSKLAKKTGWDILSRSVDGLDLTDITTWGDKLLSYDTVINCIAHTNTYDNNKQLHWDINYKAVSVLNKENLLIAHSTSAYPCEPKELNLKMIPVLAERYQVPIGYSGHETGLQTTVAAVTLGACFVERHVTLDRAMWGSDQSASVEPPGVQRLVRDIRTVEEALGDGVKKVYESELKPMSRLRK
jgi:hypothetical protein